MSYINNNAYPTGLPVGIMPDAQAGTMPPGLGAPSFGVRPNDSFLPGFRFPELPPTEPPPPSSANLGADGTGMSGFMNLMGDFINALQSLLSNLAKQFGFAGSGTPSGSPDTYVRNADASSVGDPHDAFNGTNASGQTIGGKWNNMQSHADLLESDSFAGGYTVSTTTTTPKTNGVTMNARANVALDRGATDITMNANGSFSVSSYGQNVQLQKGQSVKLGDGATVALSNDDALTVNDTTATGGSLSTRLAANGHGGVDVTAEARNVDLGGYLVNREDTTALPGPIPGYPDRIYPEPVSPLPVTPLPMTQISDPYGDPDIALE